MATESTPRSRRALLGAALGALAGTLASAARPLAASAADGDILHVGDELTGTSVTKVTTAVADALYGDSGSGVGVQGDSTSHIGVVGRSTSFIGIFGDSEAAGQPGILGQSEGGSTAIQGYSGPNLPPNPPPRTGVHGYSTLNGDANGVYGQTTIGTGVRGASDSGLGVQGTSGSFTGVRGDSTSHIGVVGTSSSFIGVYGHTQTASQPGMLGQSLGGGTAIQGYSGPALPPATLPKTGVYGYAVQDASSRGVVGQSTAGQGVRGLATTGIGVRGYASTTGTAGSFESTTGFAIQSSGRLSFGKASGVATIVSGLNGVTVTPGTDVAPGTLVLATLNGNAGGTTNILRVATDPATNRFTIILTANATANVKVAWLVLG